MLLEQADEQKRELSQLTNDLMDGSIQVTPTRNHNGCIIPPLHLRLSNPIQTNLFAGIAGDQLHEMVLVKDTPSDRILTASCLNEPLVLSRQAVMG